MSQLSAGDVMSEFETRNAPLLNDVNAASGPARNGWIVFMAVLAYLLIALSGVDHADLLLNAPMTLPVLQVDIGLRAFFVFAPMLLLLLHFNLLLQHVALSRKVRELHDILSRQEGHAFQRTHRLRLRLHSYFYVQAIAGPSRSPLFSAFLHVMTSVTLWFLPLALLIYFEIVFLPYHDIEITTAHRAFILVDFLFFAIFWIFLHFPASGYVRGVGRSIISYPLSFLTMLVIWVAAMFFSFAVATIPGEGVDRMMASFERFRTPVPFGTPAGEAERFAFLPTAFLFEGRVSLVSGQPASWFSRSIIVTDTDVVRRASASERGVSLRLRGRAFRYAVLDRSNLSRADLSGSDLRGASLRGTDMRKARLRSARLSGADLTGATLVGADLQGADLRAVEGEYRR